MCSDLQFEATLIRVRSSSPEGIVKLRKNCTHVSGIYWIMEGDVDILRDAGVKLREVAQGVVGALGGLSEAELKQVCKERFGQVID